jgi:hypothetical protein
VKGWGEVLEAVGTTPAAHENFSNQNDSVFCNNAYVTYSRPGAHNRPLGAGSCLPQGRTAMIFMHGDGSFNINRV